MERWQTKDWTKRRENYSWLLSVRKLFNFDGKEDVHVPFLRKKDADGFFCFHMYDSLGKPVAFTRHPVLLKTLIKIKGSINLHIKMYAEDRANGLLPKKEFDEFCEKIKAPQWFIDAVENQKSKYYPK